MTSLSVFESDDGYLVVDSRLIAERLNIQHESLVRTINKYKRKLEAKFGLLRPQIGTVTNSVGAVNEVQYFWLTESQASTLMTLSRNTDEVVDLKFELVEAFEKLKEIIKSRRAKQFSKKLQDATLKIYTLDVPVKWSTRGRVFQQDFYEAVYKIKGKPPCDNPNQHPVWMAQVTIDLIYRRLQPGLWDELSRKNPKSNGKRKFCCHQFLSDNIGDPHLRSHLYAVTRMMKGYSSWDEFKYNLNKCYPKTEAVQMDILFDLFSQSPEDYERWHGWAS